MGTAAGLLAALIGSAWGAVAGYIGGQLDALMMRVVDAAIAIPTLVLLLLLSAIYTPSPAVLVLVIAASSWLSTAHLVRGAALRCAAGNTRRQSGPWAAARGARSRGTSPRTRSA